MPAHPKKPTQSITDADALRAHMGALKLPFMLENHQAFAQRAADKQFSHLDYLSELISGEAAARDDRRVQRCINLARFPVLKTLDQFDWNWPTKINRPQIQNLFHLDFITQRAGEGESGCNFGFHSCKDFPCLRIRGFLDQGVERLLHR